jgi:hypothetical protein
MNAIDAASPANPAETIARIAREGGCTVAVTPIVNSPGAAWIVLRRGTVQHEIKTTIEGVYFRKGRFRHRGACVRKLDEANLRAHLAPILFALGAQEVEATRKAAWIESATAVRDAWKDALNAHGITSTTVRQVAFSTRKYSHVLGVSHHDVGTGRTVVEVEYTRPDFRAVFAADSVAELVRRIQHLDALFAA